MGAIERAGSSAPLVKNEVRLSGRTVWRIYLYSMALTVVAGFFAYEAVVAGIGEVGDSLGWFGALLIPHGLAAFLGGWVRVAPYVAAAMFFLAWVVHLWTRDIPKSLNRQHSHGDFVHSHKYDERLTHFHDDHTDRVYYR